MNLKMKLFILLSLSLLLAACTTTGGSPVESSAEVANEPTPTHIPVTAVHFEHNGLSFNYEPDLLGEAQFQEIPASSNQGMFEQPSPVHTWIGFVPSGMQRDISNHWMLAWEPSITVYNLPDFGSFAQGDQFARERVTQFQALAGERPSTIKEQIPVIIPINAGQIIRAQVKWLDFGNGVGVRFVTQYDQAANPINNEGLVYIFQGITTDGLHGVTAVFPLDAVGLPDSPAMSEPEYTDFIEHIDEAMTAVTQLLNSAPDEDFTPSLSQLDAMIQSITVEPTDTDFVITVLEPQYGHMLIDTDLYASPAGTEANGTLSLGDAVVVNAQSEDGNRYRILCADGSTGNCWVDADALQIDVAPEASIHYSGDFPQVGDAVRVKAVANNPIYNGPGETYLKIGDLRIGEHVEVFGPDDTAQWQAVICPRNIGISCWVTADTAVNEPTDFFGGDGWQEITSEYVTFRVPGHWQPTAVTPGMGSVLTEWYLGIPDVESDPSLAAPRFLFFFPKTGCCYSQRLVFVFVTATRTA